MRMSVLFSSILTISVLTGCASVQPQEAQNKTGSFPELGKRTTVAVGQVMVSKYDYLSQECAVLRESLSGSFWKGRDGLAAGTKLVGAISSGEQVYCSPPPRMGAPCLKDTNRDGMFDHAYTMNAYGYLVNETAIEPRAYHLQDQSIQDGFKYELIYQGIDSGVVRIAYREYTDNLARPAFSQDLTYTLEPEGTRMRFRDLTAVIHAADNSMIDYTVESGF